MLFPCKTIQFDFSQFYIGNYYNHIIGLSVVNTLKIKNQNTAETNKYI